MPKINPLSTLQLEQIAGNNKAKEAQETKPAEGQKDFGQTISDFVNAVNDLQKESSGKVADVIQGRSQNLHEAMAAMQESKLSFQLMVEIRNKLLESYKEIQRMQV
jgi:flagellar hook-basal body complex protein FliE